ncbi:hypothetical protein [Amycolatopsis sp. NPDC059021]|uniref:hypothetical protein n=1 Tax=Amycolatopsis sp. NPDC059021 TaxID=3346704 RepID=UPI00366B07D3
MAIEERRLTLEVTLLEDPDETERTELAERLCAELRELDVDSAGFVPGGPAPAGSKADAVTLSTVLLTFAASGGVFTTVIGTVRDWLLRQRQPGVVVDVKIDGDEFRIEGATSDERQRLLEAFVAKHSAAG